MRILANENFPGPVVRALRELGHDVQLFGLLSDLDGGANLAGFSSLQIVFVTNQ
jgi:hypothetical protein